MPMTMNEPEPVDDSCVDSTHEKLDSSVLSSFGTSILFYLTAFGSIE